MDRFPCTILFVYSSSCVPTGNANSHNCSYTFRSKHAMYFSCSNCHWIVFCVSSFMNCTCYTHVVLFCVPSGNGNAHCPLSQVSWLRMMRIGFHSRPLSQRVKPFAQLGTKWDMDVRNCLPPSMLCCGTCWTTNHLQQLTSNLQYLTTTLARTSRFSVEDTSRCWWIQTPAVLHRSTWYCGTTRPQSL